MCGEPTTSCDVFTPMRVMATLVNYKEGLAWPAARCRISGPCSTCLQTSLVHQVRSPWSYLMTGVACKRVVDWLLAEKSPGILTVQPQHVCLQICLTCNAICPCHPAGLAMLSNNFTHEPMLSNDFTHEPTDQPTSLCKTTTKSMSLASLHAFAG